MASPEYTQPVEYATKRMVEAGGIVKVAVEPVAVAVSNSALLGFYFFSMNHPRLRSIFWASYLSARQEKDGRLKKNSAQAMV